MAKTEESRTVSVAGYTVKRTLPLPHLDATYHELVHDATGARHIHIETTDDNNAFAVIFPTVPQDSTGVAHILEHVVLAGSERYPVRDPFFSMTRRSLATFMNAGTSSDWTIYWFSSRNSKDFANLTDVYLDAAFFPRIDEDSFKQEGIRLEFEDLEDPNSGLRYKGVVFNEMKGAMASQGAVMGRAIGKAVFPGLTYANNSGGDPAFIPDLTWEQLKRFHASHYHPSNASFFTYGNIPLEATLKTVQERVMERFQRSDAHNTTIPDIERFAKPVRVTEPFQAAQDGSSRAQALVAWATVPSSDSFHTLAMDVLANVLLDNAGSPLRKALIDSKLGTALADGTGYNNGFKESVFAAGLKDIDAADAVRVEDLILGTLQKLSSEGLDKEQIDAALHSLEFQKRERSNAGFPYGFKVLFGFLAPYLYGGDPYEALNFDADLKHLMEEYAKGGFFENLIRTQLLENQHRALITLEPSADLDENRNKAELARLAKIEEALGDADKARIVDEAKRLKEDQDRKPDLSVLPTLELTDVPFKFEQVPSREVAVDGLTVNLFPQPTNGITYLDIKADYSDFTVEEKELLPLFATALTHSGAAGQDYVRIATRIAAHTGGINASPSVSSMAATEDYVESFGISGKALDRNNAEFVGILSDLLLRLEMDPARLKQIIAERTTRLETGLANLAFTYANLLAQSKVTPEGVLNEQLSGITQLHRMRKINALAESDLGELIKALDAIRVKLLRRDRLTVNITAEPATGERVTELLSDLAAGLVAGGPGQGETPQLSTPASEARTAAIPVAFNARLFKTVRYTHPDAPALLVLANYLRDTFIHRELREKGGAYGGHVLASINGGWFGMLSFRDPHVTRTYNAYDEAVVHVTEGTIDAEPLKEAILGACGDVDPLESPDTKGRREAQDRLTGHTLAARENFKKRLLEVTAEDLRRVAGKYLANGAPVQATVAGADLVEAAAKDDAKLFGSVTPV